MSRRRRACVSIGEQISVSTKYDFIFFTCRSRAVEAASHEFLTTAATWLRHGPAPINPNMNHFIIAADDAAHHMTDGATQLLETNHEDDFDVGDSLSHRIFCACFRRDARRGKGGTDRAPGTLLPLIRRRRHGLQLY